ncbi:hypothetical protein AN5243.2 [Aspergillus nidulans FGSC A4]|nr:hypothetical protein AN5243.2 [Aspergillus nidulans FGSC A4]|eukprot:XP_662847.1 hypothetical protein AN5243.2 [Aspergillus nidulans FGSC A4]
MDSSLCNNADDHSRTAYQLSLLKLGFSGDEAKDVSLAPVFTGPVLYTQPNLVPSQYGLLAGVLELRALGSPDLDSQAYGEDPRLFFNVSSPSSIFICGSQGSGKSHTLSCLLEGCLIPSAAGQLHNPLTAVVFHYDTFIGDQGGSPCEAAFLATSPNVQVRVLCAPTNFRNIQVGDTQPQPVPHSLTRPYRKHTAGSKSRVHPLQINQQDLNTKRMLDLMTAGQGSSSGPLYLHTVQRVLREMRLLQQVSGGRFDYQDFKKRIFDSDLLPSQQQPVRQRLDILESFMPSQQIIASTSKKGKKAVNDAGTSWSPKVFLEQDTNVGRVVALDEAHKYMKDSAEAQIFTETLLSSVRLQRHLATRIVISTQEPTISADLLSLCSVTIVHRFSSPAWLRALQHHVAAAALGVESNNKTFSEKEESQGQAHMSSKLSFLDRIVRLRVGEALLFAPSAVFRVTFEGSGTPAVSKLGGGYMKIKTGCGISSWVAANRKRFLLYEETFYYDNGRRKGGTSLLCLQLPERKSQPAYATIALGLLEI